MTAALHVISEPGPAAAMLQPVRLEILDLLREPDSATGLSRRMDMPRQKVNYHLRQLESAGLVELVEERPRRGRTERIMRAVARSYLLGPDVLGSISADPASIEDQASSAYLVAVAARTIQEVSSIRRAADRDRQRVPTMTLQSEVRFRSSEDQHAFAQELTEAVAHLVAKYHDDSVADGRPFRLMAGAYPVPREEDR